MKIDRKQLLEELGTLIPYAGKGATNPENTFEFIMDSAKRSFVIISTTDYMMMLRLEESFPNMKVPAMEFFMALKAHSDDVDLDFQETQIILKSKKANTTLSYINKKSAIEGICFPKADQWNPLPPGFSTNLGILAPSTEKDNKSGSYILNCVYLEGHHIVATDGTELTYKEIEETLPKMFIPYVGTQILSKLPPQKFYKQDGCIFFLKDDKLMIALRTVEDAERYPIIVTKEDWSAEELEERKDYFIENLLDIKGVEVNLSNKKELIKFIKEGATLCKSDTNIIRLKADGVMLVMCSKNNTGKHFQRMEYESAPFEFNINAQSLLKFLENANSFILSDKVIMVDNSGYKRLVLIGD